MCTFLIRPPLYFPLFKQWHLQSTSSSLHFPSMSPALVLQNAWHKHVMMSNLAIGWESSLSDDSVAAIVKGLSDTGLVSSCDPKISAKPISQRQSEAHNCHTDEQPYKCTQCGMAFKRTAGLRNHRRTLCKEAAYVCVKCRDSIPCRQDRRQHSCGHCAQMFDCSQSFKRKSSLVKHELSHGEKGEFNSLEKYKPV